MDTANSEGQGMGTSSHAHSTTIESQDSIAINANIQLTLEDGNSKDRIPPSHNENGIKNDIENDDIVLVSLPTGGVVDTSEKGQLPNIAEDAKTVAAGNGNSSAIASGLRQRRRQMAAEDSTSKTEEHQQNELAATQTAHSDTAGAASSAQTDDQPTASTTARENKGKEPDNGPERHAQGAAVSPTQDRSGDSNDEFSCNICFDTATDPVLTICGHLFCWSCLVQWLERSPTCPVCKAGCDKDKVIPVYGRGREEKDPRQNANIPNRPAGQRPPPPPRQTNQFFGFDPFGVPGSFHGTARGGNFVFTGGFGLLPTLMGFSYTFGGSQMGSMSQHGSASNGQQPVGQQAFASRVFMMVAAMILVSILFY